MNIYRRKVILGAAGAVAASPFIKFAGASVTSGPIKAVAFDAFPIFDPRPAFKLIETQYPGDGDTFRKMWFETLFRHTWLRTAGNRYRDFWQLMEDALQQTAAHLQFPLSVETQTVLMDAFLQLPVWQDVKPALQKLRAQNIRLAFLSNMTEQMLRANLRHNDIEDAFEFVLSTDRAGVFKPHPAAYQLGVDAFGLNRTEIAFAAFAGWDAAGATWFGYPTAWVNRASQTREVLDVDPETSGSSIDALLELIAVRNVQV